MALGRGSYRPGVAHRALALPTADGRGIQGEGGECKGFIIAWALREIVPQITDEDFAKFVGSSLEDNYRLLKDNYNLVPVQDFVVYLVTEGIEVIV